MVAAIDEQLAARTMMGMHLTPAEQPEMFGADKNFTDRSMPRTVG
jgi:hypothetical protein